jgi:hypothetical protein
MGDASEAKQAWQTFRVENGFGPKAPILTPPENNIKLVKAGKTGIAITYGLALAQSNTSGVANTCPFSTKACRRACVALNGNGRYDSVGKARSLKVKFLLANPSAFYTLLAAEIDAAVAKFGSAVEVRLNTFSDLRHEEIAPWLFADRPTVRFYDYTKDWGRNPPANYHLTLSASERTTDDGIMLAVASGRNVAVVFSTKRTATLPTTFEGMTVVDGDASDARWHDGSGVVVGLRAKGLMTSDPYGMVRAV